MSQADRTTAATPMDVARAYDATVQQTNFDNESFIGNADEDVLESFIVDAENEWRQHTGESYRIGRQGIGDTVESYEEVTYRLSGHKQYRRSFSHATFDYAFREGTVSLDKERVVPFDPEEGDAVYIYAGLNADESWVDITDEEGETWEIVNHRQGRVAIDPNQLKINHEWFANEGLTSTGTRQRNVRLAVSYRYGSLGGSRHGSTTTSLTEEIADGDVTPTVGIDDGTLMPTGGGSGPVELRIGKEYVLADPDPSADQLTILQRGLRETDATNHPSGARVNYTPPAIRKAIAARAGMEVVNSGRYRSWAPDSEDAIDADSVYSNLESIWADTVEAMS